jgi:ElaB/YqjD/DUF883 family membrane-anchored ribosome-binding protein
MKLETLKGIGTESLNKSREGKSMAYENQADYGSAVPPQAKEKVRRGVTHARQTVEDFGSAVGAMADEYRARGKEVWGDALHRVHGLEDQSKQYVRANPIKAVLMALGVAFVLGLIFRNILSAGKRG